MDFPICPPTGEWNRSNAVPSVKPYPIHERFLRYYAGGLQVTACPTALRALDGVGGRVFTHRIEHTFE
jgi:hypothetical protein